MKFRRDYSSTAAAVPLPARLHNQYKQNYGALQQPCGCSSIKWSSKKGKVKVATDYLFCIIII